MKRFRTLIIFAIVVVGFFATEYASRQRLDPKGRVSSLREYLGWRPSAEQFAAVDVQGKRYVIAYGPSSSWLLSSGPSAYVFDDAGRLVDWSPDIGDDPNFDAQWGAQRCRRPDRLLTRSQVEQLAGTQSPG